MEERDLLKFGEMIDRQEILACMYRYARALDRHDDELLRSVFHEDAMDNHGRWTGGREAFVQWANYKAHDGLHAHMHNITTHSCEIDGNIAHAESYVIFVHRVDDNKTVRVGGGRYLDRLEKRDGIWKIVVRRLIIDYRFVADGSMFGDADGYEKGTQNNADPSYQRPLTIPPAATSKS